LSIVIALQWSFILSVLCVWIGFSKPCLSEFPVDDHHHMVHFVTCVFKKELCGNVYSVNLMPEKENGLVVVGAGNAPDFSNVVRYCLCQN
jgi:hypothetical protein